MLFGRPSLAADLPLPRTPIYDSHSQSYFQLFGDNVHPGNWEAARIRAAQKFSKGVLGRLAVVDSAETHAFLLRAFKLNRRQLRSEEHTSEPLYLLRLSSPDLGS